MLCGVRTNSLKPLSNYAMQCSQMFIPTIGNYIIESLLNKNIEVAFGYNKLGPYTPIYEYANNHDNFNIVFEKYEKNSVLSALKYNINTNNMGVIVSASTIGFGNIITPIGIAKLKRCPLLLLSFFESAQELKVSSFPPDTKHYIKESITLKTSKNFIPNMESLISYGYEFPAGPVHLNISNSILNDPIDMVIKKQPVQPNVSFSRQLCNMYMENDKKKRETFK